MKSLLNSMPDLNDKAYVVISHVDTSSFLMAWWFRLVPTVAPTLTLDIFLFTAPFKLGCAKYYSTHGHSTSTTVIIVPGSFDFHVTGSDMLEERCRAIFATQNQFCIAVICIAIHQCKGHEF